MCGSTNNARDAAFDAARTFFNAQGEKQIGTEAPTGPTRQHIAFIQSLGGAGDPPPEVLELALAEDTVLVLVRDVQIAQQRIINSLLDGSTVSPRFPVVETLVASLNNLKDAIDKAEVAQAAHDKAGEAATASIKSLLDAMGASDEDPVTLQ